MSKRQSAADINVGDIYGCIEVLEKLSPEKFKVRCNKCGLEKIHHCQWLRELRELQPEKCKHCDDYKPDQLLGKIRLIKKVSPEKWQVRCENCGKIYEAAIPTLSGWKKRNPQYCHFCTPNHKKVKIHNPGEKYGCYELVSCYGGNLWEVKCLKCGRTQLQSIANIKKMNAQNCYFCTHPDAQTNPHTKHGPKYNDIDERIYHYYQSRIISENNRGNKYKEWSLSLEKFKELIHSNCYYCGEPPSNDNQWNTTGRRKNGTEKEIYINGIDRVDASKGYFSENCVPCCWSCNQLKSDLPIDIFFNRIERIYRLHCSQTIEKRWISEPSRVESSDSKQSAPK